MRCARDECDNSNCNNYAHAHVLPKCFKSLHTVGFRVVLRVDLVLRVAVIVHSICIPNSCILHIAKTGLLRCCLYTVLTGISDPELVFGFHSSHVVMCELVLIYENSMGSTLADKVLKKTLLDLQKRFPMIHLCPKCLAAHFCGSAFSQDGSAFHQDLDEVGSTRRSGKRSVFHERNSRLLQNLACEFLLQNTKIGDHPLIQPSPLL